MSILALLAFSSASVDLAYFKTLVLTEFNAFQKYIHQPLYAAFYALLEF